MNKEKICYLVKVILYLKVLENRYQKVAEILGFEIDIPGDSPLDASLLYHLVLEEIQIDKPFLEIDYVYDIIDECIDDDEIDSSDLDKHAKSIYKTILDVVEEE